MIKLIKWFLILKLWRKSKSKIVIMLVFWIVLLLLNQVFNDLITLPKQDRPLNLLYLKWAFTCFVLGVSSFQLYRIYVDALLLIGVKQSPSSKEIQRGSKKQIILEKQSLKTKSDVIIAKYQNKQEKE